MADGAVATATDFTATLPVGTKVVAGLVAAARVFVFAIAAVVGSMAGVGTGLVVAGTAPASFV